jgi:hypothetical protein
MADLVKIYITGYETLYQRLLKLPKEARDAGVEEANKYLVTQMQVQPPKPHGNFQWTSDKQRRYVMAKIKENGYVGRTQELRNAWKVSGRGYEQIVINEMPYAQFVQDTNQIIGHKVNGWQTVNQVLRDKSSEILRKFEAGVKNAIKKLGL